MPGYKKYNSYKDKSKSKKKKSHKNSSYSTKNPYSFVSYDLFDQSSAKDIHLVAEKVFGTSYYFLAKDLHS